MIGRRWSLTDMPRWARSWNRMALNPSILDAPVRIIGDIPDPTTVLGQRRGVVGTGFLCAVPSRNIPGLRYGYVVTAHHVIEDQNRPEVQAPQPRSWGQALQEPVVMEKWLQPLDGIDLALARFGGEYAVWYGGLATDRLFLPPDITPPLGGTVHYVGILEPEDRVMARSGTLGALDQEGLDHPGGYVYTAHLMDSRSYAGFSGSPCFVQYDAPVLEAVDESRLPHMDRDPGDTAPRGSMDHYTWLCGMLTWHLADRRPEKPASLYGVVAMLPHTEIWRGLMALQDERDTADEENAARIAAQGPKPTNLSVGSDVEESEFERFDALVHHLANTPKPKPKPEDKK
jgi:Trypsin-like peptidase domain